MQEDPNYNEVATAVDMFVEKIVIQKPIPLLRKIINKIFLVINNFLDKIRGKKKVIYKPEPVDLKYVIIKDLDDEKIKGMGRTPSEDTFHSHVDALESFKEDKIIKNTPSIYAVRNRRTGSVVMTNGTVESLKAQFNNNDYEIVEMAMK